MINNQPLVSVMIPVYNGEKTLPLALSSLIHQTYTNWKAIIVNDGSTDGTKAYLDSLTEPRFKVIHFEKNKGRPYARQAALEAAEGKYLGFLDADDFYHPEKIEKQVKLMQENPEVDLVSCANASFDSSFRVITVRGKGKNKVEHYVFGNKLYCALRTSIVKLKRAKDIRFNLKLKHAQDTDFLMKYLQGAKYFEANDVLYYYSEFVSVSKFKTIKTNYYGIYLHGSYFSQRPMLSSYRIVRNVLKIIIKLIFYPLTNNKRVIQKRGVTPLEAELNEYKKTLKKIMTKDGLFPHNL